MRGCGQKPGLEGGICSYVLTGSNRLILGRIPDFASLEVIY